MTDTTDHDEAIAVQVELPWGVHETYEALIASGMYENLSDAVREALRDHLRNCLEASHHRLVLTLDDEAADLAPFRPEESREGSSATGDDA